MTDPTTDERELRTLLANVRTWHSPGDAPYRLADAMATTLDDNATLRARVEELERERDEAKEHVCALRKHIAECEAQDARSKAHGY